jgi:hypothetical protein
MPRRAQLFVRASYNVLNQLLLVPFLPHLIDIQYRCEYVFRMVVALVYARASFIRTKPQITLHFF